MDLALLPNLEMDAGRAAMEALAACVLENDASTDSPREGVDYVWDSRAEQ